MYARYSWTDNTMTARKVQAEIDRVCKKIQEGIADFEDTLEKMNASSNPNMVNKYEASLKTEIKKLQRCRDQMKAWIASPEVKDKNTVVESRKLIESYMEKFKAIEKEMKTKAYSKEGLMQSEKIDPKQKEKSETSNWISEYVDDLSRQVNILEAEAEGIGLLPKKKKDHKKMERLNIIKNAVERHKYHINRLELVLRMLANDHVSAEKVNDIKDSIGYYVEGNQDPNFEEDEYVYDELNLDEEEELYAVITEEHQLVQSTLENNEDKFFPEPLKAKSSKINASKLEDKPQPLPPFKESSVVKAAVAAKVKPSEPSPIPPIKEASADNALKVSEPPVSGKKAQVLSPKPSQKKITIIAAKKNNKEGQPTKPEDTVENHRSLAEVVSASNSKTLDTTQKIKILPKGTTPTVTTTPNKTAPSAATGSAANLQASKTQLTSDLSEISLNEASGPAGPAGPTSTLNTTSYASTGLSATSLPQTSLPQMQERRPAAAPAAGPAIKNSPLSSSKAPMAAKTADASPKPLPNIKLQPTPPPQKTKTAGIPQPKLSPRPEVPATPKENYPVILDDLSKVLTETRAKNKYYLDVLAKSRAQHTPSPKISNSALVARAYFERMLETGYHNQIELGDLDPPCHYETDMPYDTSTSFPSLPLASLLDPAIYQKFDEDTLFFIFYYQKGTYQQYLASQELQKNWQFHSKYSMWFKRAGESDTVNPHYEVGTFTFFDYHETWGHRNESRLKIDYDEVAEKLPC